MFISLSALCLQMAWHPRGQDINRHSEDHIHKHKTGTTMSSKVHADTENLTNHYPNWVTSTVSADGLASMKGNIQDVHHCSLGSSIHRPPMDSLHKGPVIRKVLAQSVVIVQCCTEGVQIWAFEFCWLLMTGIAKHQISNVNILKLVFSLLIPYLYDGSQP